MSDQQSLKKRRIETDTSMVETEARKTELQDKKNENPSNYLQHNTHEKSRNYTSLQINDSQVVSEKQVKTPSRNDQESDEIESGKAYVEEHNEDKFDEWITNQRSDDTLQITQSKSQIGAGMTKEKVLEKKLTSSDIKRTEGFRLLGQKVMGLNLTRSQTGTGMTKEKVLEKKLTSSDIKRTEGLRLLEQEVTGLKLPGELPAVGEEKSIPLHDDVGREWNMLLLHTNLGYYVKGDWYDYVDRYELKTSETIVVHRITSQLSKEEVDIAEMRKIVEPLRKQVMDVFNELRHKPRELTKSADKLDLNDEVMSQDVDQEDQSGKVEHNWYEITIQKPRKTIFRVWNAIDHEDL